MEWPEWAGYLAAFDTYVDAHKRGDDEHATQARRLMDYFAEPLVGDGDFARNGRRRRDDLEPVLDHLGLR